MIGTSLLFICAQTFAGCFADRCEDVIIEKIHVLENGVIGIETSGSEIGLGCDLLHNKYVYLAKTSTSYDQLYSLLVTAHISEKTIDLEIYEEDDEEMCELKTLTSKI